MIFEINANDVEKLDDNQFISLLRKLVQAELYKNKIPLRSGTIPAQINIADGGEDGFVSWSGGINETDWLPSRFIIFQSKKGPTSPSDLKKEIYTKSSQRSEHPQLNEALEKALSNSGTYIIVTASAVVGTNIDRRITAIKEGIKKTGNDPSLLSSIHIYDCNRLAEWTNTHPSVALWVNSLVQEIHLDGFQTFDDWSKDVEMSQIEFQQPDDKRFVVSGIEVKKLQETDETIINPKSFKEIDEIISTFFLQHGKSVRITGASGFGKSRFMHHLVKSKSKEFQDIFDNSQIIYCEYENVKNNLINTIRQIVDKGSKLILIVDDCPDDIHHKLSEIMNRTSSKSMVITIGVETVSYGLNNNLVVELQKASDDLIDHISKAINKNINHQNSSLIKELSQGFPRMAIYATQSLDNNDEALSSVDMLIDRIIWGDNEQNESSLESLQLLSLFTIVGLENKVSNELKEIAQFCEKSDVSMYNELTKNFLKRGVLFRQGDYGMVQPLPLSIRLSNQWLDNNPTERLQQLYDALSNNMKLRLIGRLRWIAWSDKVSTFAINTLRKALPDYEVINSEFGAKLLERFVHLCPDITMEHLSNLFDSKSIDDLLELKEGRYYIVSTLNKLAFRQQTFIPAATLLLKLGAAETESYSNNSSGYFKNLFQLYLSGTEAEPEKKLFVLDKGLSNSDNRVRKLCIDALDIMLKVGSFTRVVGDEYVGAGKALEDWQPRTDNDILDYYREALSRLKKIALDINDSHKDVALEYISSHLPGLFSNEGMFDDIKIIISDLRQAYPNWYEPVFQLNEWLFFRRNDVNDEYQKILREYYDELLPKDILDLIYFYSCRLDLCNLSDPDKPYNGDSELDYDYSRNKIKTLISGSPDNVECFLPLLNKFLDYSVRADITTVQEIVTHTSQPKLLLACILDRFSNDKDLIQISMITSIIEAASKIDDELGLECMELALQKQELFPFSMEIIKAKGVSNELMPRIINLIDKDIVEPYKASNLISYDQVDKIELHWIDKMVHSLLTKHSNGGWAAIYLLSHILYKISISKDLSKCILKAITNQNLFFQIQPNPMGWYCWHELTKKVIEGEIDEACHNQIIDFIFSVINVQEYGIQSSFADYARKILCILIDISPKLVWEKYISVLPTKNDLIKFRLNNLIVNFSNPKVSGIFSKIPQENYVPWMEEDKNQRIPLILEWIELFDKVNHNPRDINSFMGEINNVQYSWSSKFIDFIDQYIDNTNQLTILGHRLQYGTWSGSYAHKLNIERDQLIKLKKLSKNQYVRQWINDMIFNLENIISIEEKREQNWDASFLA